MYELVAKTNKAAILENLYDKCFPNWIHMIEKKINERGNNSILGDNQHFDAIIALMSASVIDCNKNI